MRRMIIGLDLEKDYSQISYYSERTGEPESVSITENQDKFLIPTPEGLLSDRGKKTVEALADFIKKCLGYLNPEMDMTEVYMMVTMREVRQPWISYIRSAAEKLGIQRENLFLQSYRESFFYYVINQKKELWFHASALFEYNQSHISSWLMKIDSRTKPALVSVQTGEKIDLGYSSGRSSEEWDARRDQKFLELIQRIFREETVSSTFLIGDNFDKTWAVKSLQYLCRKRHVFQGRNLYTKGACYAMCRKLHMGKNLDSYLYASEDMVEYNIGMQMDIRGQKTDYMLISAGMNWYEAQCGCEILLNEGKELVLYARSLRGGDAVSYSIMLEGLPDRPPKTTRLHLQMEFESVSECRVRIRDMGFGEFFPSSGLTWESVLKLK